MSLWRGAAGSFADLKLDYVSRGICGRLIGYILLLLTTATSMFPYSLEHSRRDRKPLLVVCLFLANTVVAVCVTALRFCFFRRNLFHDIRVLSFDMLL